MFNQTFRNTLFGTALFQVLGSTATARADASCNVLISTMRSTLDACGPGSACTISAQHAGNFYQHVSDFVDVRRVGYGLITLRTGAPTVVVMSGNGSDVFSDRFTDTTRRQAFDFRQPSPTSFDLVLTGPNAGKVAVNTGPLLDPRCFFDKFMVVATPNSIDTFSFLLPVLF
jgi:hypothetical protein